ncbi:MAG: SIS domain-containing protein [Candidatus Poribacteria bacterium]|nr:SIS domain-containing protein [Candidatus Poribacteria bacterium]MDE0503013.1 SIS domain-containing protein [Candidatus Poribacteria bacterium]
MENSSFASQYLESLSGILLGIDASQVQRAVETLRDARDRGSTIYSCGNGGSASIASQMVVDLVKGGSYGKPTPRIKMIGLTDSIATVTAYANDVSYDSVFVEQLKNWAAPDDVLIAISGSGNSQNVLNAVEYANECNVITIACTTAEGGKLRDLVRIPLLVPSSHMGHLEDCFFAMTHVLCYAFIEERV